jgi:PAT family beta-lactamase induction signal transducer AmpG
MKSASDTVTQRSAAGRYATVLSLGFASGLPLALSGQTLQAWLTTSAIDIRTIAAFSLVGLPYTLKFLWAPLMDRFVPPLFGRRRGWVVLMQPLLAGLLLALAAADPASAVMAIGMLAIGIAFASASQDVAIDAYRADLLRPRERGLGSALSVAGYRLGMLASGAGALILADRLGWEATFWVMAALLSIGLAASLFGPEPAWQPDPPRSLQEAIVAPFMEFFRRPRALLLLAVILLYKLGDAFAGTLTTVFLLRGLEFSLTDVGIVNKGIGLAATIVGGLVAGLFVLRFSLFNCLLGFGMLQAVTNLGFMLLAVTGKSYAGMVAVIVLENLSGGMGTTAFVALLMALCDHRYTATQFALLSALAAIGRVFVGPPAGVLVDAAGWPLFFLATFAAALPGLVLLFPLRAEIDRRGRS